MGIPTARLQKTFAAGKSAVVSIIVYRNISSIFREPRVEQPKHLPHLKEATNSKIPRAAGAIWASGTDFS